MAWTDPRTWSVGEIVTAAQMNAQLRDNMNVLNPVLIEVPFDGSGGTIDTDMFLDFHARVDLTIDRWELSGDTDKGLLEIDILSKPADTDFSGSFASTDSITSTDDAILIDSDAYSTSSSLTNWSPTITSPRILRFQPKRATNVSKATLTIQASRD